MDMIFSHWKKAPPSLCACYSVFANWRLGGGAQSGNRFRFRLRCVCEAVCGREADVSFGARASEPKFVGVSAAPSRAVGVRTGPVEKVKKKSFVFSDPDRIRQLS